MLELIRNREAPVQSDWRRQAVYSKGHYPEHGRFGRRPETSPGAAAEGTTRHCPICDKGSNSRQQTRRADGWRNVYAIPTRPGQGVSL